MELLLYGILFLFFQSRLRFRFLFVAGVSAFSDNKSVIETTHFIADLIQLTSSYSSSDV